MDVKTLQKATLALVGTATIVGSAVFLSVDRDKGCYINLKDVNNDNLISKMIEEVEKREVKETEVQLSCDFKGTTDDKGTVRVLSVKDTNCVNMTAEQYLDKRNRVFKDIKEIDKQDLEEAKQTYQDFIDIWNYNLFRSCGLK
jgi:uncharacterized membrane protein